MNKILFILILIFLSLSLYAQDLQRTIEVSNIILYRANDSIEISFSLAATKKAVKSNYSLILTPALKNKENIVKLPSVTFQGKKARISEERYESLSNTTPIRRKQVFTLSEEPVSYSARLPYDSWMTGSSLLLNTVSVGCCKATETKVNIIAENLLKEEVIKSNVKSKIELLEQKRLEIVRSTADRLSETYSFILPIEELDKVRSNIVGEETFDDNMPLILGKGVNSDKQSHVEEFVDRNRDGSLTIFYRQAIRIIDPEFKDNLLALEQLIASVSAIENSSDSRVARIIIAGFASPEGSLAFNDQLAWDRALAVKEYILKETPLKEDKIRVFNGSVDWRGLQRLVEESDMYEKQQIVDIITHTPVWDSEKKIGRHGELQKLNGGRSYRHMYNEFFPLLRNAAYIKVYYENKRDDDDNTDDR